MKIIFKDKQELEVSGYSYRYNVDTETENQEQSSFSIFDFDNASEILTKIRQCFTPDNIEEVTVVTEDESTGELTETKLNFSKLLAITLNLSDNLNSIDIRVA